MLTLTIGQSINLTSNLRVTLLEVADGKATISVQEVVREAQPAGPPREAQESGT